MGPYWGKARLAVGVPQSGCLVMTLGYDLEQGYVWHLPAQVLLAGVEKCVQGCVVLGLPCLITFMASYPVPGGTDIYSPEIIYSRQVRE